MSRICWTDDYCPVGGYQPIDSPRLRTQALMLLRLQRLGPKKGRDFFDVDFDTKTSKAHCDPALKVPKREIFVTELIILSHPIWIGDLRNEPKNLFV